MAEPVRTTMAATRVTALMAGKVLTVLKVTLIITIIIIIIIIINSHGTES